MKPALLALLLLLAGCPQSGLDEPEPFRTQARDAANRWKAEPEVEIFWDWPECEGYGHLATGGEEPFPYESVMVGEVCTDEKGVGF